MSIAKYKMAVGHADTKVLNMGAGSAVDQFEILETEAGLRTTTGGTQTIQDSASTGEVVRTGDTVKYVNLFLQAAPRDAIDTIIDRVGWVEWALVMVKESETDVPTTDTGIQTLGVICNNMFRNECIFSGSFPIGSVQPNSMTAQIKVPKFKQRIKIGDEWRLITLFRSASSTSTSTATIRLIKSFMYKAYS